MKPYRFKVDTGADTTVMAKEDLYDLGYECKQWPLVIVLEDGKDFRNLIGRDLLAGFNYTFDNDKKKFFIEKTKSFSYIGNKFKGQSINELKNL